MDKIKLYNIIQKTTPPFIFEWFKKSCLYSKTKSAFVGLTKSKYNPIWNTVTGGILSGHKLFFDTKETWQKEMLDGTYDKFMFDYIDKLDLTGKVAFDIGTHIGFHSLCFAKIVGDKGRVISFEPNKTNIERIKYILGENSDLAKRIQLCEVALSDKNGQMDLVCTDNVENGTSSGGFLDQASTLFDKKGYEMHGGFKRYQVKTVRLDDIEKQLGVKEKPYLIKMDTEGAEGLILDGALEFIRKYSPIILMEVHSIDNMFQVMNTFLKCDYEVELLKKELDGRCFLAAKKR